MEKKLLLWGSAFVGTALYMVFFQGCSTAKVNVMPGENGLNSVVSRDIERDNAEKAAVDAAHDYCKEQGKTAVFLKNDTTYTGQMDEGTRNTVRNASKAASVIGFQNRGTFGQPSTVESAGNAGTMMTNDRDYKTEISFKCK